MMRHGTAFVVIVDVVRGRRSEQRVDPSLFVSCLVLFVAQLANKKDFSQKCKTEGGGEGGNKTRANTVTC